VQSSEHSMVSEDIRNAVETAIQFGCDAKEFKRLMAAHWEEILETKKRRDIAELVR
jgi:hypothetical protein